MTKIRGFSLVSPQFRKHPDVDIQLPRRADAGSAGYDFIAPEGIVLAPGNKVLIWTDVKAYMQQNEVLQLYVRSSIGTKKDVLLANSTGIIDASYHFNDETGGNIGICLINNSERVREFEVGERIAQGIFLPYLVADNDNPIHNERTGGFGSSGK